MYRYNTRQMIRETWAKGHDNVYFVLGEECTVPPKYRHKSKCELKRLSRSDDKAYVDYNSNTRGGNSKSSRREPRRQPNTPPPAPDSNHTNQNPREFQIVPAQEQVDWQASIVKEDGTLADEESLFGDLIKIPHPDVYKVSD